MTSNSYIYQLKRFIIVGFSAVIIDFIFYNVFIQFSTPSFSKAISFFIGSISSYFANKLFTFKSKNNSIRQLIKFLIVYISSLFINVYINALFMSIFTKYKYGLNIAFVIAVTCSASFNFIGMKKYVFKNVL